MIIKNEELRIKKRALLLLMLFVLFITPIAATAAEWSGVDESVVEKYAEEHGRPASDPVINTDQGDLLLFVFLLAGAVGGFVGGYYWRELMERRPKKAGVSEHRT